MSAWVWAASRGVVAVWLLLVMLLPLAAKAQPAGVPAGAVFCSVCDVPAVEGTVLRWWQEYIGVCDEPSEVFGPYLSENINAAAPGCFDPASGEVRPGAGGIWFQRLELAGPDEPSPGFDFASPASHLQLLFWSVVPLIGFWGYSMGARE